MLNFLPQSPRFARRIPGKCLALWACLFLLSSSAAWAKDVPVTGILLYGAKGSIAYVQVSGFLINTKTELRACSGGAGIDKSAYKNLVKINLAAVKTLERLPDGSMVAEVGDAPASCVVPGNFKYDKEGALTPAELAEKSTYAGQVVGSSAPGQSALPPFAPGAKMVFGSASDKELAEYLVADRMGTIPAWQSYLAANSAGAHLARAKSSLTTLLVKDGGGKLALYKASRGTPAADYASLKDAHDRADQALAVQPADASANELRDSVRAELKLLSDDATAKLHLFQDATKARKPGYDLLVSAKDLSDHVTAVDPQYPPGVALAAAMGTETHSLDSIVQIANSQITAKQYSNAYSTIGKYLSFADEEPRLKQIVATVYKYNFDKGNGEIESASWTEAVADEKTAISIKATDEAKSALIKAEAGLLQAQNKAAADQALRLSKGHMDDGDTIGAYEVLMALNSAQQLLVKDQMSALQDAYVQSATSKATELQQTHTPIKGRADEDAMRLAYDYFDRAGKLSDDSTIGLKLGVVADTISGYYVDLATKYLSKPLSSGVGLGWCYLNEATFYHPNLDAVRNAMTSNNAAYQMRAKLSIGVLFHDQTSHHDSEDFRDQLQQAFVNLERSGLPVKVILPGSGDLLKPNFQFVGVIQDHRTNRVVKKESLPSQYRSGSQEEPNPAWNKADGEYEFAVSQLQKAQSALSAAQIKGNKKLIDSADQEVTALQTTVQQAREKMNAIPKSLIKPIDSTYNYTRTTLDLTNIVKLSFSTLDSAGTPVGEPIEVIKGDKPREFIILDNIKPEDTQGIKEIDVPPNETQLMTDVEIEARDEIVKAAHDRAVELPQRILAQARALVAANDMDGAGEEYVLYLNSTPATTTPERTEALTFLFKNFNIRNTASLHA